MPLDLSDLSNDKSVSDQEVILAYGHVLEALRNRGIIRTKNVVGELGERYCEMIFNQSSSLPNLTLVATNEQDIDAIDEAKTTYSIKTVTFTSAKRTGSFHLAEDHAPLDKRFDMLLVVIMNDTMTPRFIYRLSWNQFWSLKSWSSTQRAWYLRLSNTNLGAADMLFGG